MDALAFWFVAVVSFVCGAAHGRHVERHGLVELLHRYGPEHWVFLIRRKYDLPEL